MAECPGNKILWFLAGGAIGAGIALLYAPKSGQETRKILSKRAEESSEAIVETAKEILERGRDIYEKGRKIAEDAADIFERGRKIINA